MARVTANRAKEVATFALLAVTRVGACTDVVQMARPELYPVMEFDSKFVPWSQQGRPVLAKLLSGGQAKYRLLMRLDISCSAQFKSGGRQLRCIV